MNETTTLGGGGFGSVIKARWLDSEVVVKKLEIDSKADADKKREIRRMFENEVDIWFGLSHPHVVRLFGACHVGRPFFVCELAPNGTLDEYLHHHPDKLWTKLREAALGVQYLHARGIVHGDLKGNNIMIGGDGKAKVTDFGLSGVFGDDSTEVLVSAALHWVAPECMLKQKPTFASDVYSLGICIIEALRVTNGDEYTLPRLSSPPRNCSDDAWTLIQRMCKNAPADRIQVMTVVDELEKLSCRDGDLRGENGSNRQQYWQDATVVAVCGRYTSRDENLLADFDTDSNYECGVLKSIYQLLWDRLEQVATQLLRGDDTVVVKATISDFSAVVERSKPRTRAALDINGVIPLIKFTELALGGYALHRRLDKFMAAHAIANDSIPLHDWTSACSTLMEVSANPHPDCSDEHCSANEATQEWLRQRR